MVVSALADERTVAPGDDGEAKFWLDPVRLVRSHRFAENEINKIENLVVENHQLLLDSWNEFFYA